MFSKTQFKKPFLGDQRPYPLVVLFIPPLTIHCKVVAEEMLQILFEEQEGISIVCLQQPAKHDDQGEQRAPHNQCFGHRPTVSFQLVAFAAVVDESMSAKVEKQISNVLAPDAYLNQSLTGLVVRIIFASGYASINSSAKMQQG